MKTRILALTLLGCAASMAAEHEGFICITDKVNGFNHNPVTDDWEHATFLPGERFQLRATSPDSYQIEKLDELRPWTASCRQRDDLGEDTFSCEFETNAVHFSRKELRFTAFRYFGFWSGSKDSVSVSIGSCYAG
jgi:hypothetical protein